jgi:hypothetical protein
MKIFLALLIIPLVFADFTMYMGFDTDQAILDPTFFECVAGRINYNRNGFSVIPYVPTADFVGQIIRTKKAGFLEVHLVLDPNDFSLLNPQNLAITIQNTLSNRGTGISGVWLKVISWSNVWSVSKAQNVKLISSVLDNLKTVLRNKFGDVVVGIATTSADFKDVVGNDTTLAAQGYLYWSLYGDKYDCDSPKFGFSSCYLQQIQVANYGCDSPFNLNVKRISN